MNQYLDQITDHRMFAVQRKATDVAALAASGCDSNALGLALDDLRDAVSELGVAAREQRKAEARNR